MTPEQRQLALEEFQRLAGLDLASRKAGLEGLRRRDPVVSEEVERLLSADERVSGGVSEQLRGEVHAGSVESGPTLKHEGRGPRKLEAERIGPYRVIRELGHGGLGFVLLGVREDDRFHKRVAIKLVKKGMDTDEILRRFEQERQVLSALNHPNIARVFDAGTTDDGRPYFVMEYVEGLPIDVYCDSQGLSTEERLRLFRKVCGAVHYAHQNLIVHRDIKPSNIMVTSEGEPKLLDFGIAKLLNPDLLFSPVTTGPELRLMTPEYASPEQVEGLPITTASDVYSLGVLLYTLLTGHPPYRLKSRVREEIVRVVCEVDPERPSTSITKAVEIEAADGTTRTLTPEEVARNRDGQVSKLRRRLAGDIDNIVLMAMRKKPPRRYKSAEQFAEDIDRHLGGRPVIARPETWWYIAAKFSRRNRVGIAATVLVFVSLVTGLGVAAWQWSRAQQRYEQVLGLAEAHIDLQTKIGSRVGSTAAQKLLVEASLPALNKLADVPRPDDALHALLARGYAALGVIEQDLSESDAANRAVDALTSAVAQRRALWTARPGDISRRAAFGEALVLLAAAQTRKSAADGRASLDEATRISDDLEASHPGETAVKRLRVLVTLERARAAASSDEPGARQDAMALLDECLSVLDSLKGDADRDPQWFVIKRSEALIEVGDLHVSDKQPSRAEAAYREAISVLGTGAANHVDIIRGRILTSEKLGNLLINSAFDGRDRTQEALEELGRTGAMAIRLATDDPQSESSAELMRRVYETQGDAIMVRAWMLALQGKTSESQAMFRRSLEFMRPFLLQTEKAWEADRLMPGKCLALATACEKMGEGHRHLGELAEAEQYLQRAVTLYAAAGGARPESYLKNRAGECLANLGFSLHAGGKPTEAENAYTRAIDDLEAGLAGAASREHSLVLISNCARNLGLIRMSQDDHAGALRAFTKAREWMAPDDAGRHLVLMGLGCSQANTTPPDHAGARTNLQECIAAYKAMPAPGDQDHQIAMTAMEALGRVLAATGEAEPAKTAWREAIVIAERIAAPDPDVRSMKTKIEQYLGAAARAK